MLADLQRRDAEGFGLALLMPRAGELSFAEANRLILVASVLNLILPSKMGDIAKASFMRPVCPSATLLERDIHGVFRSSFTVSTTSLSFLSPATGHGRPP